MRNVRQLGLVLVAVCAFCAMTAASAVAHPEFLASAIKAQLSGKATQTQKFNTDFGAVECTALTVSGETTALRSTEQEVTVNYKTCKAFGLGATVSPALYLFLSLGNVHILSTILIASASCHLLVLPQTVSKVLYANLSNEILITPEVSGIAYEGKGPTCSGSNTNGTYEGKSLLISTGNTLSWMP